MPTIYRVILSNDRSPTEFQLAPLASTDAIHTQERGVTPFVEGLHRIDRGIVTPAEYQAILIDERIVPLPHPMEASAIRQHGGSFLSASLKGRYLRVTRRLCLHCGRVLDAPRISFHPAVGCLPGIAIGIGVASYLVIARRWGTFGSIVVAIEIVLATMLVVMLLGLCYARLCFRARQQGIGQDACPHCGSKNTKPIEQLAGKCVELEDRRTVSVEMAGVS